MTAPDALLLGFARALRAAGLSVTADREAGFLEAVCVVGFDDDRATYWAGRATLCTGPDDFARYDQVFWAWFSRKPVAVPTAAPGVATSTQASVLDQDGNGSRRREDELLRANASGTEVLRHRDVAQLDYVERRLLAALFGTLPCPDPQRRASRRTSWHRGEIDARRTLRRQLERMGEPGRLAWRRRGSRSRRVVLLVDVSGSMSSYADSLLRLAHRWSTGQTHPGHVEVFTMGTRLTHVTRALRQRDPDRALAAAGEVVPDWSGGTRLGESLKAFLDRWGQRGMARGAVVVIFSDGWERGGVELLEQQMRRLQALAHRVVWVNPHRGKAGYQPIQQGIVVALPHCDALVAGHSLRTFEDLAAVVGHA
ncbi:VWA domain-containing protein [Lapillicoccus sp.]|uniref:vWA domain-containing protein n=1 Tax=Lapillicoccus sp. TaxID=1909287 RepID=UPI0027C061BC|nr:VWA domain-containing protein [Actinomycetota bacterium]